VGAAVPWNGFLIPAQKKSNVLLMLQPAMPATRNVSAVAPAIPPATTAAVDTGLGDGAAAGGADWGGAGATAAGTVTVDDGAAVVGGGLGEGATIGGAFAGVGCCLTITAGEICGS